MGQNPRFSFLLLLLSFLNQPQKPGCPIFGAFFAPKVGMYKLTQPALAVVLALACSFPPSKEPSLRPERTKSPTSALAHWGLRSEEHTSELQSHLNLVCRLLLEKKNRHSQYRALHHAA